MLAKNKYDFRKGKERVEEILKNDCVVEEKNMIPNDENFTFNNSYRSWITSIFVDIRNSTDLCINKDSVVISKVFRSFTSEVIEILNDGDDFMKEIGIRGDCVYGIYSTPFKENIMEVVNKAFYVNTFMKMLNRLLERQKMPNIKVGIGIATSNDLIVKAGRKNTGINSKIWIGKAVPLASKYSSLGNKNGNKPLIFSSLCYHNFIEELEKIDKNENPKSWFELKYDEYDDYYYTADIVKSEFDKWISDGMRT